MKYRTLYIFLISSICTIAQLPAGVPGGIPTVYITAPYGIDENQKKTAQIEIEHVEDEVVVRQYLTCGIELRGNSTRLAEKKSYDIEFRTETGEEKAAIILDFTYEEDFILLANAYDKSFVRNALAFEMWKSLGHYTPKYRYCNVVLDEKYQGLYMLVERIKVDENRIDIRGSYNHKVEPSNPFVVKLDWDRTGSHLDNTNGSITGDILHFDFVYPKERKLTWGRREAIVNELNRMGKSFRQIVDTLDYGVGNFQDEVDLISFVDYFLVNELSKNPDAFKTSVYLHQPEYDDKGNPGKISIGPIWDMDLAFANVDYGNYSNHEGWSFQEMGAMSNVQRLPTWWHSLVYDSTFINLCQERLALLKERFSMNSGDDLLDHLYVNLVDEVIANEKFWPEQNTVAGPFKSSFENEIQQIRRFYLDRLSWVEENIGAIEKVHPDVAYMRALKMREPEADTAKKQFLIEIGDVLLKKYSGMPSTPIDDLGKYTVKNIKGEIVAEGSATSEFLLSYEGWEPGEYYLQVDRWVVPGQVIYAPISMTYPLKYTSAVPMFYPTLSYVPTPSSAPYYVSYVVPPIMAASYGIVGPQEVMEKWKVRLIVP